MENTFEYLIIGAVAVLFVSFFVRAFLLLRKAGKIKKEGYDASAVISRVEYSPGDADSSETYYFYVRFRDMDGIERECRAGLASYPQYEEGDKVTIRYLPDDLEFVRIMDEVNDQ